MGRPRLSAKSDARPASYLGDIPEIARRIASIADDDDGLCRLHEILYGSSGVRSTRKLKIRKWNGTQNESKRIKLSVDIAVTSTLSLLKEIAVLLGIEIQETRREIEDSIASFLAHPVGKIEASRRGRKFGSRNRSSAEIEKQKISKSEKKKKVSKEPVSVKGNRGRPRKFNPVLAFTYFVKQRRPDLIRQWTAMSDSEKRTFWVKDRSQIDGVTDVENPR